MDSGNAARKICGFDIFFLLAVSIQCNNVARICLFATRHELGIIVVDRFKHTFCMNVLARSQRLKMRISRRPDIVRCAICKIDRSRKGSAGVSHGAKSTTRINSGARTSAAAFNRQIPACNVARRMAVLRQSKCGRMLSIQHIRVAPRHKPILRKQGHNLFCRKALFRQCCICRILDRRNIRNVLIQQYRQNIEHHVKLLTRWLAVQTANDCGPAISPIVNRNFLPNASNRERHLGIIGQFRSRTCIRHRITPC